MTEGKDDMLIAKIFEIFQSIQGEGPYAGVRQVFVRLFGCQAVISSQTSQNDIIRAAKFVKQVDSRLLFILQPNTFDLDKGVVEKCDHFQRLCFKNLPNVRVMPQMHKFMKIQ